MADMNGVLLDGDGPWNEELKRTTPATNLCRDKIEVVDHAAEEALKYQE
jgi:hypothetical protein